MALPRLVIIGRDGMAYNAQRPHAMACRAYSTNASNFMNDAYQLEASAAPLSEHTNVCETLLHPRLAR